jgi:SulP family sulfate permease
LVAALIALPYGLAMATLMGLPPVMGLFTSLLTCPITVLLGRNPLLIGGTSTVTVPFMAKAVADYGIAGAAKITLVAAVFIMCFSVLRLGRYILQVPIAVVSGFSCGIGAMMVIAQLRTIFGLSIPASSAQLTPVLQIQQVWDAIGGFHWQPFVLGITVIAIAFAATHYSKLLPSPLIGVVVSIIIGYALGLHEKEVGKLPIDLPPLASFAWSPADLANLAIPGLGLAFVASVNLLITSRVVEHFRGRHRIKPSEADAELGAYGIANVCAGMFGAPVSVGIPARSLAAVRCGATTRFANVVHGAVLLACLWLGAEYVSKIPLASLAGVTAYVGICLLEWSTWRRLPRMRRSDSAAFILTFVCTLVTSAVAAVAVGCAVYGLRWVVKQLANSQRGYTLDHEVRPS